MTKEYVVIMNKCFRILEIMRMHKEIHVNDKRIFCTVE
jgi:hypothetical protein